MEDSSTQVHVSLFLSDFVTTIAYDEKSRQNLLWITREAKLDKCCQNYWSESVLSDRHPCLEGPSGELSRDKSVREKMQAPCLGNM